MANEILYAGIGDLRLAETLSTEYLRLLAAREALPNHPALLYAGDAAGTGSAVLKISQIGLDGYDLLASTADGAAVGSTALTDGSTTVTVARYSKAYTTSDLARLTGSNGLIDPASFAQDAQISGAMTLVNMVAALSSGFTTSVGTSGVDATVENHLDAKRALNNANVEGGLIAIYHPNQWSDIIADLALNTGGAVQWDPANIGRINMLGNGYQGQLAGVDVFTTTYVPTANAGADRGGMMFGRGAIAWADASVPVEDPSQQISLGGKVLFERDRTAAAGTTQYVTHRYLGVAECIDAAGVAIVTDA